MVHLYHVKISSILDVQFLWLARLRASHYLILKRRYVESVVRIFVKQRNRPEASTVSADCSHILRKWKGKRH